MSVLHDRLVENKNFLWLSYKASKFVISKDKTILLSPRNASDSSTEILLIRKSSEIDIIFYLKFRNNIELSFSILPTISVWRGGER